MTSRLNRRRDSQAGSSCSWSITRTRSKANAARNISKRPTPGIGGRYFIVGDAYSSKSEADSTKIGEDSQVGIAWDESSQFYVFSPEQMDNMVKKWAKDRAEQ